MAIINGINYLQFSMYNFKLSYMKNDIMKDILMVSTQYSDKQSLTSKFKKIYDSFKLLINQDILYQIIMCFIKQKRFLEGAILIQYSKKFDNITAYKLLKNTCDKNEFINIDCFKYIWKMVLFEYLANSFYRNNNYEALSRIKVLIKRVSNHQFFKGHIFRKNFKIVNFFNFLDYLNNIKYNF